MRTMSTMRTSRTVPVVPVVLLLSLASGALPLLADDVYLKNGRSFAGVVADVGDSQVRIHMPGGTISLPRGAVDHVRKADSAYAEYLERKSAIESRENGSHGVRRAGEWVELARWARSSNLPQGAREAALTAAEINPREAGLAGLLRGFGYVFDESVDGWISYEDSMRRHGFVQDGGTWVSREEHAERVREREAERSQRQAAYAAQAAAAAAAESAEMLRAQLDLAQQGGGGYGAGYGGGYGGLTLGTYYGDWWPYSSPVFSVPGFGFGGRPFGRTFSHHGFGAGEHRTHGERHEGRPGLRIGQFAGHAGRAAGHAAVNTPAAPSSRRHP
jgi:hypothetical protein